MGGMSLTIADLRARAKTPGGVKAIKYTLVSVISIVVTQIALVVLYGLLHWTARSSNILAVTLGGIPSYWLNRRWVWKKSGRSHLWKETVPFWALNFFGLALSTWAADFGGSYGESHFHSHLLQTACVAIGSIGAFGVLWVGKFLIFNKLMFGIEHHRAADA
jgi:putative flippase GtrA